MKQYLQILRDNLGQNLKHSIPVLIDNHAYREIRDKGIEFGARFNDKGFIGLVIITKNGKEFNNIQNRSVSELLCGIKNKRRNPKYPFDFRKEAYMWNMDTPLVSNTPDQCELLTIEELKFHIEYLNLLRIKIKVESSEKFKIIKEKLK